MKVFMRTFIICLVLCAVWTAWSVFENHGFKNDLDVNSEIYNKPDVNVPKEEEPDKQDKVQTPKVKIYFLNSKNALVMSEREIAMPDLEKSINALLKGTTPAEAKNGVYSEIPTDVKLLSVTTFPDKVIVNLNSKFIRGGGTTTILNRIKQLKKTVDAQSGKKPIYLQIEGKQIEYVGGDGVYLEQPLNEDVL